MKISIIKKNPTYPNDMPGYIRLGVATRGEDGQVVRFKERMSHPKGRDEKLLFKERFNINALLLPTTP